jgi:hypothetical protein
VVALAAVLRLARLDLAQFQSDEATWLRIGEDLVRLGRVPLYGPLSSQGITQAPQFEYFLAAAAAVSRDPVWVTTTVALANVAGVAGTVWLGWRAFGPLAGVVAGLWFATQPGAVFYARKIWPPDVLPPLGVLLLVALEYGVVCRRARWAAASLPIAALTALMHFGGVVVVPFALAPVVVLLRARRWFLLAVGLGLAAALVVPYLVHQAQTGWADVKNVRYYASSVPAVIDTQALEYALSLSTGWGRLRVADVLPPTDGLPSVPLDVAAVLATALLGLAVVAALWQVLAGARRDAAGGRGDPPGGRGDSARGLGEAATGPADSARGLGEWPAQRIRLTGLLVWLVLPVLLTTRHSLPLQPHYYLILVPAPALLIGFLCQSLLARLGRWGSSFVLAALAVVLVVQVASIGRLLEFVATQYEPCYGAPVRLTQDIGAQAVAFGAAGGATRVSIENEDGDADSIGYLLRGAFPLVDLAGVGPIGIGFQDSAAEPSGRSVLDAVQAVGLSFEPGLAATAASVSDDPLQGGRVRVALNWQVEASSSWARPLVWEVRLVNAGGEVVQRASGIDHIPASMGGEHVLSWFTLDTPREIGPGPYQVHLRLLDADRGQPVGSEWLSGPFAIHQTARCRS